MLFLNTSFKTFLESLTAKILFNSGNTCLTLDHKFFLKHEHIKPRASLDADKKLGAEGLASSASNCEILSKLPNFSGLSFPSLLNRGYAFALTVSQGGCESQRRVL